VSALTTIARFVRDDEKGNLTAAFVDINGREHYSINDHANDQPIFLILYVAPPVPVFNFQRPAANPTATGGRALSFADILGDKKG
jgi:hypothetical protein